MKWRGTRSPRHFLSGCLLNELSKLRHYHRRACQTLLRSWPIPHQHNALIWTNLRQRALLRNVTNEAGRLGERLVAKLNDDPFWSCIKLLDIGLAAESLDEHDLQQVLHLFGHRTKTINQFSTEPVDLPRRFKVRKAAIKGKA